MREIIVSAAALPLFIGAILTDGCGGTLWYQTTMFLLAMLVLLLEQASRGAWGLFQSAIGGIFTSGPLSSFNSHPAL